MYDMYPWNSASQGDYPPSPLPLPDGSGPQESRPRAHPARASR